MRDFRCAISRPRLRPAYYFCLVESGVSTRYRDRGSGVYACCDVLIAADLVSAAVVVGRFWCSVISSLQRLIRGRRGEEVAGGLSLGRLRHGRAARAASLAAHRGGVEVEVEEGVEEMGVARRRAARGPWADCSNVNSRSNFIVLIL